MFGALPDGPNVLVLSKGGDYHLCTLERRELPLVNFEKERASPCVLQIRGGYHLCTLERRELIPLCTSERRGLPPVYSKKERASPYVL